MGQLRGPTQVFKTPQLWRVVSEGGEKRRNLQQQLYLCLPGSHPLLHVRPKTSFCYVVKLSVGIFSSTAAQLLLTQPVPHMHPVWKVFTDLFWRVGTLKKGNRTEKRVEYY